MGAAYFLCGLIPLLFIKDRLYDPQKLIKKNSQSKNLLLIRFLLKMQDKLTD